MRLQEEVPKDTELVHGTSIDAINLLFKNNEMPPTKSGYFYFEPVGDNFLKSEFGIKESSYNEPSSIFNLEQFYAIDNARKYHLEKEIGYIPDWITDAVLDTEDDWFNWLFEDEKIPIDEAKNIARRVFSRKGVLLIPSKNLLSRITLKYCFPHDGVRFKVTDPIKKDDFEYIVPQGRIERDILASFGF